MRTPQVAFPLAHCTPPLPATKVGELRADLISDAAWSEAHCVEPLFSRA